MATRIYLVRHGETEWGEESRFYGVSDISLSEEGHRQSQKLASRLAIRLVEGETVGVNVDTMDIIPSQISIFRTPPPLSAIYSSPLKRCLDTALAISAEFDKTMTVIQQLNEVDYGAWEGASISAVSANYPEHYRQWLENPAAHTPPRGETIVSVAERAAIVLQMLIVDHPNQLVILVGPKAFNQVFLCKALNLPLARHHSLGQDAPAISVLDVSAVGGIMIRLNERI